MADPDMLSTIFRNLISNAVKFSPTGGEIHITSETVEDKVRIGIIDSGIGIPQHMISTIFSKEQNMSREGTSGERGSGLGLQICKDFVEKNRGEIWTESKENKGSAFYFTLPCA